MRNRAESFHIFGCLIDPVNLKAMKGNCIGLKALTEGEKKLCLASWHHRWPQQDMDDAPGLQWLGPSIRKMTPQREFSCFASYENILSAEKKKILT
ncbi:hypothetical protein CEXT_186711 [Caerostris extrusa]|uniref:Uncharacterized protein n=1 Tax=Caerostris extrusa TaxID=172846 RepID=A0AAV4YA48_CAEEX|nr:hypothetical protein CEXT_186711 [Caerostris extrusa]